MSDQKKAVVLGVGVAQGVGGTLCKRFAADGHHVFIGGRTERKIEAIADSIAADGGNATPVLTDATNEQSVVSLFDAIQTSGPGQLDLAIYNAGNNTPGKIIDMEADYFEAAWRIGCFGAFLFGREAVKRMLPKGGALLFTGASSSMRGRAGFGAFTAAKGGLRNFAQAMSKEYGPEGIHVGHVVVDGGIDGERLRTYFADRVAAMDDDQLVDLPGIADAFSYLYRQQPRSWTFEVDLRTYREQW